MILKPISSLALIWLYFENKKRVSAVYPFIIAIIMLNDFLILFDFDRFFDYISVLASSYYLLCSYLLIKYVSLKQFKFFKICTPPLFISVLLIIYLTITVLSLVKILENSFFFSVLILISLFLFLGISYFIYFRNQYKYAAYLFITVSSCILVNSMVPIQELYYNHSIFAALINSVDIVSMFFYLKFLIHAELIEKDTLYRDIL